MVKVLVELVDGKAKNREAEKSNREAVISAVWKHVCWQYCSSFLYNEFDFERINRAFLSRLFIP